MSSLLVRRLRKQRVLKPTKKHPCGCFVFWWYFASQRQRSFALRNLITLSNPLGLQPHMQPIVKNQKRHFVSAFCDTGAFCYAKQSSVALRNPIILSNLLVLRLRKQRIYRTKKAPLQVLLGFWFYFAAQRQCSFASAERLLCKSFLYCNRTCNRSTNHRVVAHADEAHHFDVCGNG